LFSYLLSQNDDSPALAVADELKFLVPLLMQYPKCYWIWNYRIWLLELAISRLEHQDALQIWRDELVLVGKMLVRDERNFHGWDYRRRIVSQIENLQGPEHPSLVESEFEYTTKMIRKALQNFSALHYRSKLIPRLLEERKASSAQRRAMFDQELNMMLDALIDPFNQSAWFYHQFLMSTLDPQCSKSDLIITDLSESERAAYFDQEIGRIKDMLEDFDDCKWIYQALIQYCSDIENISGQPRLDSASKSDMQFWLTKLRNLDPARRGRWADLQNQLGLQMMV
jgi:geranylgeranyl transferase type-2 subunit alpha